MKKTLTVNLNSIVFNIDDDAFEVLNKYLAEISNHFSSDEEKNDIMADIEARIAELFNERLNNTKNVVTLEDVNHVINVMGKPNQFSDTEEGNGQNENSKQEKNKNRKKHTKRYYRDPENQIIGGVAAGFAAYTGWDITLIRLILIILAFITNGFMILAYIVVWIVAPKAVTAAQRLEMQGEEVTIENIKNEFGNAKTYVQSEEFKSRTMSFGQRLGEILKWLVKAFFIFIGIIAAFVCIVVLFALLIALFAVIFNPLLLNGSFINFDFLSPHSSILAITGLVLVVGCPIFMLLYWIIRKSSKKTYKSKTGYWVTFILWLAGLFMLISVSAKTAINYKKSGKEIWTNSWNYENFTDEVRVVDTFHAVDVSGNIKLDLIQGNEQNVIISSENAYLSAINTTVKNGVLYISSDNAVMRNLPVQVDITTPNLNKIVARGASRIEMETLFNATDFNVLLQGASKADLLIDISNEFKLTAEGASEVDLEGKTENLIIKAYGASKIDAENLISKNVDIEVAGASAAKIHASERLDAGAFGVSSISCYGNPKIINKNTHIGSSITVK